MDTKEEPTNTINDMAKMEPSTPPVEQHTEAPMTPSDATHSAPKIMNHSPEVVTPKKGQSTILLVVGLLFLLLALVVGAYWYIKSGQSNQTVTSTSQATPSASPADTTDKLDADLKAIDLGNVDDDFKTVNTDVDAL